MAGKNVISVQSLLSDDCILTGNLSQHGSIKIDGKMFGDLTTDGNAIIGEHAEFQGTIRAKNVLISGKVSGDVIASGQISLTGTAEVHGDISYEAFLIDEGAKFAGNCTLTKPADPDILGRSEEDGQ